MFLRPMEHRRFSYRKEKMALPAPSPLQFIQNGGVRTFLHLSLKAGLTVETACVLPLFLWTVMAAFYLIEVSCVQTRLVGGIREAGRKLAVASYAFYGGDSDEERGIGVGEIVGGTLSAAYAKNLILDRAKLGETALEEETSVSLAASDFSDENVVDLKVMTRISIPVPFFHLHKLKFLERGRVRAWTGQSPAEKGGEDGEEEEEGMVYMTVTGTVYHRSADCSHIRLSITSASVSDMSRKRNSGGAKYYPCGCYKSQPSQTVYYTKNGTRYHSSLSCSGLKRTVKKVKLSSLQGVRPCSKCG